LEWALHERRRARRKERKEMGVKRVKTGAFGARRSERKTSEARREWWEGEESIAEAIGAMRAEGERFFDGSSS